MGTRVFISYSSKDGKSARAICSALESRGLSCWISSRDVGPGENFMDAIVNAISAAKVMVLVFSENANNSDDMKREIVLASSAMVTVIPVRVEDVVPKGAFAYQLATRQWIDLFEDWEAQIERLVTWIAGIAPATPNAPTNAERLAQEEKDRIRAVEAARLAEEETQRKKDDAEAQRIAEDNRRQQAEAQRIAEEQGQQQAEAERLAQEEKDRIRAAQAARLAEEETQRKKDDAEAQRIAEDNRRQQAEAQRIAEEQGQQAEAERLAQEEKDRTRAAQAARLAEEETKKKKVASEAAAPSEKGAHGRMFAVGAALIAVVAIAIWFVNRAPSNNSATASEICDQTTDANAGLAACTQAIALNPKDQIVYNNRCSFYIALGNYSAALADCNQAIALDPKDKYARSNRCSVYINLGNPSAALPDCNQAIALDPKLGDAYSNRCGAYSGLGQYRAGLADCNQAIALNPKDANAYYNRAFIHEKLGTNAEAIADFQQALTINPSDQDSRNELKRLGASPAASGGR